MTLPLPAAVLTAPQPVTRAEAYATIPSDRRRYVSASAGDDGADGLSPGTAKATPAAALASIGGGPGLVELVGAGVIPVTDTILLPSNTWLLGGAATLQLAAGVNKPVIANLDPANGNPGVRILGGIIDGNKLNQPGVPGDATHVGILMKRCDGLVLDDVTVQNTKDKGIYVRGSDTSAFGVGGRVAFCRTINCGGFSFALYHHQLQVVANRVEKTEVIAADHFNVGGNNCVYLANVAYNPGGGDGDFFAIDGTSDSLWVANEGILVANGFRFYATAGNANARVIGNKAHGKGNPGGLYGVLVTGAGQPQSGILVALNHLEGFTDAGAGYGVLIAGEADVFDNDLRGNRIGGSVQAGFTNCRVKNNRGWNPVGVANVAVTASPWTYTNNDNVSEMLHLWGGVVSAVSKNGNSVSNTTPTAVWLEPGESLTVTYTGVPQAYKVQI